MTDAGPPLALTGSNFIGSREAAGGFRAQNPSTGETLEPGFAEGTHAMQHGGPWPATTDARATSVGTAAILRFARPVSDQNSPDTELPEELRGPNPRGIWRLVDGRPTRESL
jgi:hypothetical protein